MARDAQTEARIEHAVHEALEGRLSAFDRLPADLADVARQRWREAIARGEGASDVRFLTAEGAPIR